MPCATGTSSRPTLRRFAFAALALVTITLIASPGLAVNVEG
jgi:hypothetical protein